MKEVKQVATMKVSYVKARLAKVRQSVDLSKSEVTRVLEVHHQT
jgi:hypothetical protein